MLAELLGLAAAGAGALAWGVRGKSSTWLAPSVWKGPSGRKALALTFDDGPSESSPQVAEELARYNARATFFQCGYHVRRLPQIAHALSEAGHEVGNHTDSHAALYLRGKRFMRDEIVRAQEAIEKATGRIPALFRATYGARWFGLGEVQRELGLHGVMWTVIAQDWRRSAPAIAERLLNAVSPGAIICMHDGRELQHRPDIRATVEAVKRLLPVWREAGYELITVSEMFGFAAPNRDVRSVLQPVNRSTQ